MPVILKIDGGRSPLKTTLISLNKGQDIGISSNLKVRLFGILFT